MKLVRGSQQLLLMPARAIDSATIAFGLVSIPIKIFSTSEPSQEIHFQLIATKAKGGEIVAPSEAPKPVMTDLMEALKASLAGESKPAASTLTRASHAKRTGAGHGDRGHAATKRSSRSSRTLSPAARPTSRAHAKRAHAKRASR